MPYTSEEENHEWFEAISLNLALRYGNQYVVIKDKAVIAVYASYEEAVDETLKTEKEDTFSIELCSLGTEAPNLVVGRMC
jgi:hypothetical protein